MRAEEKGFSCHLEYLKVGEEVLLQPVFEVPDDEVLIRYIWV